MTLVGHTLTGAAIGVLCKPERTSKKWQVVYFCVFVLLANAPDLPFKHWGHNRYDISHSIFVALLTIAIATGLLASWKIARTKIGGWRTIIGGAAAWLSHLLLDSFYNHGRGIAIFWPFSESRLALPVPWFSVVTASTRFTSHGLREYLVELASYLPVLLLAVGLRGILRKEP